MQISNFVEHEHISTRDDQNIMREKVKEIISNIMYLITKYYVCIYVINDIQVWKSICQPIDSLDKTTAVSKSNGSIWSKNSAISI